MNKNTQTYGILGGGILGMTIALRLAQQGHKVSLFDAADGFGGLASAWTIDGLTWDKYYHVILLSDLRTRALLQELGIEDQMNWVETKTGFYTDGKLYSMSNTLEFLKFPPLNLIDKLRLGGTIFYTSKLKNWRRLEGIPVERYLRRLSGNNTFEKMWLPLLRSKLGENYKRTSAAFIWATIQRMYSARKSGLKKEMFGYMSGGYATIMSALVAKLEEEGVSLHPAHAARSIKAVEAGLEVSFSNGKNEQFDKLINTISSSFASNLIPTLPENEKQLHQKIEYLGVVCASVILKKAISPYYVTNITDDGKPFTGIIEMTALVNREKELKNKHLVYLPKYVKLDDPIFDMSDEEISSEFTDALLEMYPDLATSDIEHLAIARARNVFALNTLNYSQALPPVKSGLKGLYNINGAHITNGTLNVNESIQLAEKVLDQIL